MWDNWSWERSARGREDGPAFPQLPLPPPPLWSLGLGAPSSQAWDRLGQFIWAVAPGNTECGGEMEGRCQASSHCRQLGLILWAPLGARREGGELPRVDTTSVVIA